MAYFHGPWFVTPREVAPQDPPVSFLPQECCLSSIQDSNPLLSVVGKCCVLEPDDYRVSRKTRLKFEIQNTPSNWLLSLLFFLPAPAPDGALRARRLPLRLPVRRDQAPGHQEDLLLRPQALRPLGLCPPGRGLPPKGAAGNQEGEFVCYKVLLLCCCECSFAVGMSFFYFLFHFRFSRHVFLLFNFFFSRFWRGWLRLQRLTAGRQRSGLKPPWWTAGAAAATN